MLEAEAARLNKLIQPRFQRKTCVLSMLSAVPPANYSSFHSGLDWVDMPERIADSVKPRLSLPSILATTVGSWYSAPTTSWKSLHSSSTSSRRSCEVHPAPCQNIWFFKGEIERSSVRINIHILSHTHAHTHTLQAPRANTSHRSAGLLRKTPGREVHT